MSTIPENKICVKSPAKINLHLEIIGKREDGYHELAMIKHSIDLFDYIEFENNQKHKNYIFSSGIDLIHQFFNLERKTKNEFLSKSIQYFNKNSSINKIFTKIADEGLLF